MDATGKGNRVFRIVVLSWFVCWQAGAVWMAVRLPDPIWWSLGFAVAGCLAAWLFLSAVPVILLSEEGVSCRILFKRRFYHWNRIRQAGILHLFGNGIFYNQIVLVKENGSPRKNKDKTFLLRNVGKWIPVPCSEESKQFVIRHYGPLDFDLSDSRDEGSIVVD